MFSKSNLLGTIVGTVLNYVLGIFFFYYLYNYILKIDTVKVEGLYREEPYMFWFYLSNVLMGFIISTAYGKFNKGVHTFWKGFEIGAWTVAFFYFGISIMLYSSTVERELTAILVQGVFGVLMYGIMGGIIALVYKSTSK